MRPDLIEPFVGWKGLLADERGQPLVALAETPWPVGEPLVATCDAKKHTSPATACTCGIYAVRLRDLRENGYNWGEADGREALGRGRGRALGQRAPGRIGYRAQFAYPQKVYVPAHKLLLGARIRDRYGCPSEPSTASPEGGREWTSRRRRRPRRS